MENYEKTAVFPGGYDRIGGNTTRAAMTGLGSIGLILSKIMLFVESCELYKFLSVNALSNQVISKYRPIAGTLLNSIVLHLRFSSLILYIYICIYIYINIYIYIYIYIYISTIIRVF